MFHFFHKWEKIFSGSGTGIFNGLLTGFKPEERDVVVELFKCKKCGKKKGIAHTIGGKYECNPIFVEEMIRMHTINVEEQ